MRLAWQTMPGRVEYYYLTVSTGAEAGERLAHARKWELTQKLHEQEEEERGAFRGSRLLASRTQRKSRVWQSLRSAERHFVRVCGSAALSRESYVTDDKHAPSLLERANFAASVAAFRRHEAWTLEQLEGRERRISRREHRCWARYALTDSVSQDVTQQNGELAAELARVMVEMEAAVRQLAAYEAMYAAQARGESRPRSGAGVEESAGAEDAEEMPKKLGDQLVRGVCAEEGEEAARLFEAGRVVTAGTPHARECRSFEGTPEREFALGGKPGAQEAAQARRCLFMGGGAGEPDPVAAAVRLQCAVRGVSARHVVGRELLVRRQAESRERLAAREAEVKAALGEVRREAKRGSRRARQGRGDG